MILRGGTDGPNYEEAHCTAALAALTKAGVAHPGVIVDCSHGNSLKQHARQVIVAQDVAARRAKGDRGVMGVMLESHLLEGRQDVPASGPQDLRYGVSITDACIGWDDTAKALAMLAKAVRDGRTAAAK